MKMYFYISTTQSTSLETGSVQHTMTRNCKQKESFEIEENK